VSRARHLPVIGDTERMPELSGSPRGRGRRFAVVASRFNEHVTRALADAAVDALVRHGVAFDDVDVIWVPGAWELPSAVRRVLASERYDGVVAVGAVVRGETPHVHVVAGEAARGLQQAIADFEVPVGLGLLTCDTMAQAEARAGGSHGNKGWDAALAALEMVDLFEQLDLTHGGGDDEDDLDGAGDDGLED
jgi:6,7-dimethyl-8-ribityllumazine synthase